MKIEFNKAYGFGFYFLYADRIGGGLCYPTILLPFCAIHFIKPPNPDLSFHRETKRRSELEEIFMEGIESARALYIKKKVARN